MTRLTLSALLVTILFVKAVKAKQTMIVQIAPVRRDRRQILALNLKFLTPNPCLRAKQKSMKIFLLFHSARKHSASALKNIFEILNSKSLFARQAKSMKIFLLFHSARKHSSSALKKKLYFKILN